MLVRCFRCQGEGSSRDKSGSGRTGHSTAAAQGLCSLCLTLGPVTRTVGGHCPSDVTCTAPASCLGWSGRRLCQDSSSPTRAHCQEPGSSGHLGAPSQVCCWEGGGQWAPVHSLPRVPQEAASQLLCSAHVFPGGPACEWPGSLRAVWTGPFHVPGQGWPEQSGDHSRAEQYADNAPERIGAGGRGCLL